jgi:TP901 family phage tail tape measure protein
VGAARTVSVSLMMRVSDFVAKTKVATQATKEMVSSFDRLAKQSPDRAHRITSGMMLVGGGLLALSGTVVKFAADFDKQMSHVDAVANATAKQMGMLRQAALDAGRDTQFTAVDAAKAEEELVKAGVSVKDVLGGGLAGALDLAAAGQMELADAATIAAQAMNIFHLQGSAVPHVADVLASAANKSAADMHDLGDAMRQGGLVASQFGLSMEDTIGTLAAFADRALIGSDAGTSLKSMLAQLAAPSGKTAALMRQLGIEVYDAQGKFIGITKFAGVLQRQLGGLTQAERDHAVAQIFGTDAMRSANVLYSLGEQGLKDYITAVDDSGAAQETARKKTDNLAGDVERLTGTIQTLAIESGSGANGGVRSLVKATDALAQQFMRLPQPMQSSIVILSALGGASLLAVGGLLKARQTVREFLDALETMGPAGVKAAEALGRVGRIARNLTIAGIAAYGLYEGMRAFVGFLDSSTAPTVRNLDAMTASLKTFGETGQVTGDMEKALGSKINDLTKKLADFQKMLHNGDPAIRGHESGLAAWGRAINEVNQQQAGLNKQTDKTARQFGADMQTIDKALAGMVANGGVSQASLAFAELRERWLAAGGSLDELNKMLPDYNKAAGDAAAANTGLAKGFADANSQAKILNVSLQEQLSKGETLTDVWNTLHGAVVGTDKAMLDANNSIDDVVKAFKDNGNAIKGNSTAALENRVKIEDMAQAATKAAQAKYEETGSIEDANKVYKDYEARLIASLAKAGNLTKGVQDLITAIFSMPPTYAVTISTPGLATADDRVRTLGADIANLPASKSIHITTYDKYLSLHPRGAPNRWGGVYEHAAAGTLRDAALYSPQAPARYAFAEPATGGEAFVPKRGDYGRAMSILSTAAGWYGAMVMPGNYGVRAGGGQTTVVHEHRHTLIVEGTGVLRGLRNEIKLKGGDVQSALGPRTRVGG